jgi:hypothetical protein
MEMGAKNAVIAGDYDKKGITINIFGTASIIASIFKPIELTSQNVESYEVIDESSKTSAASAIARGFVGSLLLGPIGLLAAASAKKKGIHVVAIQFKDGKKSLLEVDDKIYKAIITKCFS